MTKTTALALWMALVALGTTACGSVDAASTTNSAEKPTAAIAADLHGLHAPSALGDTELDFTLSLADEAAALANVPSDESALNALGIVSVRGRVQACDEASCVYACDLGCLDIPVADQAARVHALAAIGSDLGDIAGSADAAGSKDVRSASDLPPQVDDDLAALAALHIVGDLSFPVLTLNECNDDSCATRVPAHNRRAIALLHALRLRAEAELGPVDNDGR